MAEHGTETMYSKHGCRCDACREASRIARRLRRGGRSATGVVVRRDAPFNRAAMRDLLDELFPFGMTTPDERREHETQAA